jgi:hypothetical protein
MENQMTTKEQTDQPGTPAENSPLLSNAATPGNEPAATQVTCSSSLTGTDQANCQSYTRLSNYLGIGGSLIESSAVAVNLVLVRQNKQAIATDIWSVCGALYSLIAGVNQELQVAIQDINDGKPYEPIEVPSNLPPFPPQPTTESSAVSSFIESIWTAVSSALEVVLQSYQGNDKLRIALSGLLENGEAALKQLSPLLQNAFSVEGGEDSLMNV